MSQTCELISIQDSGADKIIGTVLFDGQRLYGDNPFAAEFLTRPVYLGGKTIKASEEPGEWFEALPTVYDGSRFYARMTGAVEKLAKEFNEDEARDEHGRWTSGGSADVQDEAGSGAAVGRVSPYESQRVERLAQINKTLTAGGYKVGQYDDLPPELKAMTTDRRTSPLASHPDAAKGMVQALEFVKARQNPLSKQLVNTLKDVTLIPANFKPSDALLATAQVKGKLFLILNTNSDPMRDQPVDHDADVIREHYAYPVSVAAKMLANGERNSVATTEEYRLATLHEFGHVIDFQTGPKRGPGFGATTKRMMDDLGSMTDRPDFGTWLGKNISGYARASAREASAELFAMAMNGEKLPKELKGFEQWANS